MNREKTQTYDYICFTDLVYEFNVLEKKNIEKKIKRRLKYYNLGKFNQERVDFLRQLRDDLYREISEPSKSIYFHKTQSDFAELADFNLELMKKDFQRKYQSITPSELFAMITFAIYSYHLR